MRFVRRGIIALFAASVALWAVVYMLTVRGKDQNPPRITGTADEIQISVNASDEELLAGLKASDDRDGDVTDQIHVGSHSKFIHRGSCEVEVTNEYGDVSALELPVHIVERGTLGEDTPRIVLDSYLIYLKKGKKFDPKSYLQKVVKADESQARMDEVQIKNGADTSKEGVYEVTYTYEGSDRESAVSYLIVVVTE